MLWELMTERGSVVSEIGIVAVLWEMMQMCSYDMSVEVIKHFDIKVSLWHVWCIMLLNLLFVWQMADQ